MFAFLFFFNIKFFISDWKTGNEDISILGVKISLFENAYVEAARGCVLDNILFEDKKSQIANLMELPADAGLINSIK